MGVEAHIRPGNHVDLRTLDSAMLDALVARAELERDTIDAWLDNLAFEIERRRMRQAGSEAGQGGRRGTETDHHRETEEWT